jgi:uncharacterized protein YaiL (DUF2058 family)
MTDSLRDQLLGLGFKAPAKPARKPPPPKPAGGKARGKPQGKPRPRGEIDLAKAYAIRAQEEKEARIEAERLKQEAARQRREARAKLGEFLHGKPLNDPAAELVRHFEYGGKIKRIHVNEAQLKSLNAGELGVVQQDGRYLLVDIATLDAAEAIFPACVALRVDPAAPAEDDVPDDLVW